MRRPPSPGNTMRAPMSRKSSTAGWADALPDVDFDAADTSFFDVGAPNFDEPAAQVNRLFCRKYASCCGPNDFDLERCERTFVSTIAADLSFVVAPYLDEGIS